MLLGRNEGNKQEIVRKSVRFHGRVQEVGFRYTAKYLAQTLDLTGWVQNGYDGSVSMEVQGREDLINALLLGLNGRGRISIEWMEAKEIPIKKEKDFRVR